MKRREKKRGDFKKRKIRGRKNRENKPTTLCKKRASTSPKEEQTKQTVSGTKSHLSGFADLHRI